MSHLLCKEDKKKNKNAPAGGTYFQLGAKSILRRDANKLDGHEMYPVHDAIEIPAHFMPGMLQAEALSIRTLIEDQWGLGLSMPESDVRDINGERALQAYLQMDRFLKERKAVVDRKIIKMQTRQKDKTSTNTSSSSSSSSSPLQTQKTPTISTRLVVGDKRSRSQLSHTSSSTDSYRGLTKRKLSKLPVAPWVRSHNPTPSLQVETGSGR